MRIRLRRGRVAAQKPETQMASVAGDVGGGVAIAAPQAPKAHKKSFHFELKTNNVREICASPPPRPIGPVGWQFGRSFEK